MDTRPDFENAEVPQAIYMVPVFDPVSIVFTACVLPMDLGVHIEVWRGGFPYSPNSTRVSTSGASTGNNRCASAEYETDFVGSLYLSVEGAEEITVSTACKPLAPPEARELRCGEVAVGSAAQHTSYAIHTDAPTRVAIALCARATDESQRLPMRAMLRDAAGEPLGETEIGEAERCAPAVFADVYAAQALTLAVSPLGDASLVGGVLSGLFDVSVACLDLSGPDFDGCSASYIGCGEEVTGSTIGRPSLLGQGGGEVIYLLAGFVPGTVATLSTCDRRTQFQTSLLVLRTPTGEETRKEAVVVARGTDADGCSALTVHIYEPAGVYIAVDGAEEGTFALNVACTAADVKPVESACVASYLGCGDSTRGSTFDYPDLVGDDGIPDAIHLVPVFEPSTVVLSTCNEHSEVFNRNGLALRVHQKGLDVSPSDGLENTTLVASTVARDACSLFVDVLEPLTLVVHVTSVRRATPGGVYELSASCKPLPGGTEPTASCAADYLTCSDVMSGSTIGFPDDVHDAGDVARGDAVHHIAVFEPTRVTLSTCSGASTTTFAVFLYDGDPHGGGGTLLARNGADGQCGSLHYDAYRAGTLTVVIEGAAGIDGLYELTTLCESLAGPGVADTCGPASNYITCGDFVQATTLGFPDFGGVPLAGEYYTQVLVFSPTTVSVNTCGSDKVRASFRPTLQLFKGSPVGELGHKSEAILVASAAYDPDMGCSMLTVDLDRHGAYTLRVEGAAPGEEGSFELNLACRDIPTKTVDESCTAQYIGCGDIVTGTTVGFPNIAGSPAPEAVYLATVGIPTRITITTCSSRTSFDTTLSVYDGPPGAGGYKEYSSRTSPLTGEGMACPSVSFDVTNTLGRSVYVLVEGDAGMYPDAPFDSGVFELSMLCETMDGPVQDDVCGNSCVALSLLLLRLRKLTSPLSGT